VTRVLVAWEDHYCDALESVLKRSIAAERRESDADAPVVLSLATRGNGRFEKLVSDTWPNASAKGTPSSPGRIDHLVCVIDADKLHEIVSRVRPPSALGDDLSAIVAWQRAAELAWNEHVRSWAASSSDPRTVHGALLCWSKESLVLAGFDQPAMKSQMGLSIDDEAVQSFVASCEPSPTRVEAATFSQRFRKPMSCLERLFEAQMLSFPAKGDATIDDALRALGRESLASLRDRVDSLRALTELLWRLHRPAPPSTPDAAPSVASKPRGKPARAPKPRR
jgi:hypothetical protein